MFSTVFEAIEKIRSVVDVKEEAASAEERAYIPV
jgi:hypothetical protein